MAGRLSLSLLDQGLTNLYDPQGLVHTLCDSGGRGSMWEARSAWEAVGTKEHLIAETWERLEAT